MVAADVIGLARPHRGRARLPPAASSTAPPRSASPRHRKSVNKNIDDLLSGAWYQETNRAPSAAASRPLPNRNTHCGAGDHAGHDAARPADRQDPHAGGQPGHEGRHRVGPPDEHRTRTPTAGRQMATMPCPVCAGKRVAAGAFLRTLRARHLSPQRGDSPESGCGIRAYLAAPGEHVLRLSVVSSLFPRLPRRLRPQAFRVGLAALLLVLVVFALLRWQVASDRGQHIRAAAGVPHLSATE